MKSIIFTNCGKSAREREKEADHIWWCERNWARKTGQKKQKRRNTENSKQHSFFFVMTNGNYPIILEMFVSRLKNRVRKWRVLIELNWTLSRLGSFVRRPFSIAHTHLATSFDLSVQYTSISEQCGAWLDQLNEFTFPIESYEGFPSKISLTKTCIAYASTDCWLCTAHRHVHTRPQE